MGSDQANNQANHTNNRNQVNNHNHANTSNLVNTQNQLSNQNEVANNNSQKNLIWIDTKIDNEENSYYQKSLKKLPFNLFPFKNLDEGLKKIKEFKFEKITIIISGSLFEKFIDLIKKEKTKISCVLDIIIFTSKGHKQDLEENFKKEKAFLDGYLFNKKKCFY